MFYVHTVVGHAQTFRIAKSRAQKFGGKLVLRIEDIDIQRCKPHFLADMVEDLTWFGLIWDEGYGLPSTPDEDFVQSKRFAWYKQAWKILYDQGYIYPCSLSRRDVEHALSAPQDTSNSTSQADASAVASISSIPSNNISNEPVLPIELRPEFVRNTPYRSGDHSHFPEKFQNLTDPTQVKINWRFRVPNYASNDPEEANDATISFNDSSCGTQSFTAMKDFGDFLVWRLDGYPSYELAVVVDDILMRITEVVRGQDLLISTARQLLLMRAIFQLDFRSPSHWQVIPSVPDTQSTESNLDAENEGTYPAVKDNSSAPPAQKRARNGTLSTLDMENTSQWTYSSLAHPTGSILDYQEQFRIPRYFHAPLMCDETGRRLAKRNFAKSLRKMREEGLTPKQIMDSNFSTTLCW